MGTRGDEQHRYGSHYTPPEVARLLAAFAVRGPADLVFDPGCGDGRLLREVLRLKSTRKRSVRYREVLGIDRCSQPEAHEHRALTRTGALEALHELAARL